MMIISIWKKKILKLNLIIKSKILVKIYLLFKKVKIKKKMIITSKNLMNQYKNKMKIQKIQKFKVKK